MAYTIQDEAAKIFNKIFADPRLQCPDEVKDFATKVKFVGDETQPFYPTPWKCAESQAALLGYVGMFAAAISKERYCFDQTVEIDVEHALLTGLAQCFARCNDKWASLGPDMTEATRRWDHGQTQELYRQLATNIYKTRDGRWYQLHGSMNATPTLTMLDLPQHNENNLSWQQILDLYGDVVGKMDSKTIDDWSNNVYRVPGTIAYEEREFQSLPHGKAIKDEPYFNLIKQPYYDQPAVSWPTPPDASDRRPLSGFKVLELARAIAAPTIGRICAALGATVIRVSSVTNNELPITLIDGCIGKISVDINLKTYAGRKKLIELIEGADIFIDGYRPSVLEHLGFGRDAVFGLVSTRDRGIIYCQENCYGWKGPWVTRPGWAQIADTASGIGLACGRFHGYDEAHCFPGPNADYLTGHSGAAGILHAIYQRYKTGGSYLVQCSLVISNLRMMSHGKYSEEQIKALKQRNEAVLGKVRHYDEVVSLNVKEYIVRGFQANRSFEMAYKKQYFQRIDGKPWGMPAIDVVSLGLKLSNTKTDFPFGAAPPGYHLPQWSFKQNPDFEPIVNLSK